MVDELYALSWYGVNGYMNNIIMREKKIPMSFGPLYRPFNIHYLRICCAKISDLVRCLFSHEVNLIIEQFANNRKYRILKFIC